MKRSRSDICTELAAKLGIEQEFTDGKSCEDWLRQTIDESRKDDPDLPTWDEWKEMGIYRRNAGPAVSMTDFREDPKPIRLEHRRARLKSIPDRLATLAQAWDFGTFREERQGDVITPLPEFTATWEGALEARENEEYPLQVIGHHFKGRTHSSYGNVKVLKEAHTQTAWLNPIDANERGIENGDAVFVFNERGTVQLRAFVTPRIPGSVSIPQGAWYKPLPSADFSTRRHESRKAGGRRRFSKFANLTPSDSLAKGLPSHTTLAQVTKAGSGVLEDIEDRYYEPYSADAVGMSGLRRTND